MKTKLWALSLAITLVLTSGISVWAAERPVATPSALVDTYDSLANAILATKKTEWNLVHSILATTYRHAEGTYAQALAKIKAGQDARKEVEQLAALVSQIANEGDASVAAIRKRLLEAGHHHNAKGEEQGVYDEGFVIVTRAARKVFLDAANSIGKLSQSPDAAGLEKEWKRVTVEFGKLHEGARG
jgi:hypothetical protein